MCGKYYHEDHESGNEYRMEYFDSKFKELSQQLANMQGITLSQFWSSIKGLNSFRNKLSEVFSLDTSLASYVDGMKNKDFQLFFQRPLIQSIVGGEIEDEGEIVEVYQEKNVVKTFYKARYRDKSGNFRRTIGRESQFNIRGRAQIRYRDSLGRFVSIRWS